MASWKEEQKIKRAERKLKARVASAERAAKQKIESLTEGEEEGWGALLGNILSNVGGAVTTAYAGPAAGAAVTAAGKALTEGAIAGSYELQNKPELAKKHALLAAAAGSQGVGDVAGTGAAGKAAGESDKGLAAALMGSGAGAKGAGAAGAGYFQQEAAKAAPTPGSLEAETAAAFERKYGDIYRKEQEQLAAETNQQRLEAARQEAAFGGGDPFGLASNIDPYAAAVVSPPPPTRTFGKNLTQAATPTAAVGSSPGAGPGGSLPAAVAAEAQKQPVYGTAQLALTSGDAPASTTPPAGKYSQETDVSAATPPEDKQWYEKLADRSIAMGSKQAPGGIAALGTGIDAIGKSIDAEKPEDVAFTWLDWLMGNASRSSGKEIYGGEPGQASIKGGKSLAGLEGMDPDILKLFT